MRLAVLSDVHGNLPTLEAVVADVTHRGVDESSIWGTACPDP